MILYSQAQRVESPSLRLNLRFIIYFYSLCLRETELSFYTGVTLYLNCTSV